MENEAELTFPGIVVMQLAMFLGLCLGFSTALLVGNQLTFVETNLPYIAVIPLAAFLTGVVTAILAVTSKKIPDIHSWSLVYLGVGTGIVGAVGYIQLGPILPEFFEWILLALGAEVSYRLVSRPAIRLAAVVSTIVILRNDSHAGE